MRRPFGVDVGSRTVAAAKFALVVTPIGCAIAALRGELNLILQTPAGLVFAFLIGRSLILPLVGPRSDAVGFLAYLPILASGSAYVIAPTIFAEAGKQPPHSLDTYYNSVATVLGALLIALVLESRSLVSLDPYFRSLRGWWVFFIAAGIMAALFGLTPGHARSTQNGIFDLTWGALAGALTAGALVMARDSLIAIADRTRYEPSTEVVLAAFSGGRIDGRRNGGESAGNVW